MEPVTPLRSRGREVAVLAAGLAAGAALLWAGATVQDGLRTASDVAVARLSATVADTVVAEWGRMLRSEEPPVPPAGERFVFRDGPALRPIEPDPVNFQIASGTIDEEGALEVTTPPEPGESPSVFWTLLEEAERRELVEHDVPGALELVLEALGKESEDWERPEGWLRALQLGARLGKMDVVREQWSHLRDVSVTLGPSSAGGNRIPYRALGWLALPEEIRSTAPARTVLSAEDLERLDLSDDLLILGPPEEPEARFELAPMVTLLSERMGLALPPLERRKTRALAAEVNVPSMDDDGSWHLVWLDGRTFLLRRNGEEQIGWFYSPRELQRGLVERSALPPGFALDFEGTNEMLGVSLRPRVDLADAPFAFTLRHGDPASLGEREATRLKILRGALLTLAFACAAGGFLCAGVLRRARRLSELKSAFIAGVSHDLRTPLASMLLLAENLESGVVGGEGRERYHRALRKEAGRLRRLVDDVLDFSRLERGAAPSIERDAVELARFADELETDLRARVEGEGRPFRCERGALPEVASLDAHAVQRALENLIDNALKHGSGAVELSISSASGRLAFTVADEGPGVPPKERERIFEPFERLHGPGGANGHAGGTGLGLAIVRSIARAHGGEARVHSGPRGMGAVFVLELPLEEVHA